MNEWYTLGKCAYLCVSHSRCQPVCMNWTWTQNPTTEAQHTWSKVSPPGGVKSRHAWPAALAMFFSASFGLPSAIPKPCQSKIHGHTYTHRRVPWGVNESMKTKQQRHEQMFVLIWAPLTKAEFEAKPLAQGQLTLSRSKASETSSMPEEQTLFLRMISAVWWN